MRHQWRLLLLRSGARSSHPISAPSSLSSIGSSSNGHALRSLSSLLHTQSLSPFTPPNRNNPINPKSLIARSFSSEPVPDQPVSEQPPSDEAVVAEIFGKFSDPDEIRKNLDSSKIEITHDLVLKVLRNLVSNPAVAQGFFNWVASSEEKLLSLKVYNLMLQSLGTNGLVDEFWKLHLAMKGLGYGMSRGVHNRVLKKFEEDGLAHEVEKLKEIFESRSVDDSGDKIELRVCRIIRNQLWGEEVEAKLRDLNVTFSNDLVKLVLENLEAEPIKALMYFRWVEESSLCKHDEKTYNAMARILGRGDCIDRFWKLVDEMRGAGHEMDMETFDKIFVRFCNKKMIEDAVGLYEHAMSGANKPSQSCCTILLKKIVVSKNLDVGLFSRVVKAFVAGGYVLTDSSLKAVLKSLTSVDRLGECNGVLKAMEDGGYVPSGHWQRRVAFQLSSAGKKEEASEFVENVEASGSDADHRLQTSLIEGYCKAFELEKALDCVQEMVEKKGASAATCAVDLLVNAYCKNNKAADAFKLLNNLVVEKQLKPWHTTYKVLISQLLFQSGFKSALNLLPLMKADGFPPYVDPIIEYVSKSGSGDDAIALLNAMTSKKFPSKSVYLRLFEAFLKDGKRSKAQDFLSNCPGHIRNNADVLNLLCSMKSSKAAVAAPALVEA